MELNKDEIDAFWEKLKSKTRDFSPEDVNLYFLVLKIVDGFAMMQLLDDRGNGYQVEIFRIPWTIVDVPGMFAGALTPLDIHEGDRVRICFNHEFKDASQIPSFSEVNGYYFSNSKNDDYGDWYVRHLNWKSISAEYM